MKDKLKDDDDTTAAAAAAPSEFCQIVDDPKDEFYIDLVSRLKAHQLECLLVKDVVLLKHIEIPEAQRRQGLAGRSLKSLLKETPNVLTAVPLANFPALKLFRSLYSYFWPVFITWRGNAPEVIFASGGADHPGGEKKTLESSELVMELQDEFLNSLCMLAQSSLVNQPVRVISLLFDIIERRGGTGTREIKDLAKIIELGDWDRIGTYISPGCHISLVGDLWPMISQLALCGNIKGEFEEDLHLAPFQRAALIGIGLQHKSFAAVGREYDIPAEQIKIQFKLGLGKVKKYAIIQQLGGDSSKINYDPFKLNEAQPD